MDLSHPALQLFSELLIPSPSGGESSLAAIVRQKLEGMGYAHETDAAGNVLVRVTGQPMETPALCFAAHMDEIGMVVTRIREDGDLLVDRLGGLQPWKLGEGPVEILGDLGRVQGVLSMGSSHTTDSGKRVIRWEDCRVMTGLTPAQLSQAGVRPGSFGLPVRSRRGPVVFGDPADPLVGAWIFDDRIGMVTQLRLLEAIRSGGIQPAFPLLVAFTVREEVGGHGAKALVMRERPDVFVSVDGSPMPPETDLKLDGRPGIWVKDRLGLYDARLVAAFMQAAESAGTGFQPVVFEAAASDASLVAYSLGVPRIACVGHVRANSHGFEVLRLSVLDHLLKALLEFVCTWSG